MDTLLSGSASPRLCICHDDQLLNAKEYDRCYKSSKCRMYNASAALSRSTSVEALQTP